MPTSGARDGLLPRGPSFEPDLRIFVDELWREGRTILSYRLKARSPELDLNFKEFGHVALRADPHVYLDDLFQEVEGLYSSGEAGSFRLERIGEHLAAALLPDRLRESLQACYDLISSVQVVSAETWIPWELLWLRGLPGRAGFHLGEGFGLTRWFPGLREILDFPLRRMALVIPQSALTAPSTEGATLLAMGSSDHAVERIPARHSAVIQVLGCGEYDGFHFAGHGLARGANPDRWHLALDGRDRLDSVDLSAGCLEPARPLVFLNACHSGRGGLALTGTGGLARAFTGAGAGALVGCHWAVGDRQAHELATEFYRLFLAGLPFGEAGRRARLHVRSCAPGDPSWIAYTLWGHPLANCSTKQP